VAADHPHVLASRLTVAIRAALLAAAVTLCSSGAAAAAPTASRSISSNWAGYVALPSAAAARFSSVAGTWTEPRVSCQRGHASYSAVWVGLGGYRESASTLEQVGTDADCAGNGRAEYSSWYELLPAGPVELSLRVRPGDVMSASVTVRGVHVTLRIRDLSSGARFGTTQRVTRPDLSSAEWIVEAPSECQLSGACTTLALSNFGAVAFADASASARGHTGAISDPLWSATALELRQSTLHTGLRNHAGASGQPADTVIAASPGTSAGSTGAFSVSWQQQAVLAQEPSAPTLPGVPPA